MDGLGSKQLFDKAVSYSSKEFIRGFLIGQFALLLLLVFLARLLLFRTPTPTNTILRFPQRVFSTIGILIAPFRRESQN